jgi:hypothetical protein
VPRALRRVVAHGFADSCAARSGGRVCGIVNGQIAW